MRDEAFIMLVKTMNERPEITRQALDALLVARNLERVADHATNIAEDVIFWVRGADVRHNVHPGRFRTRASFSNVAAIRSLTAGRSDIACYVPISRVEDLVVRLAVNTGVTRRISTLTLASDSFDHPYRIALRSFLSSFQGSLSGGVVIRPIGRFSIVS